MTNKPENLMQHDCIDMSAFNFNVFQTIALNHRHGLSSVGELSRIQSVNETELHFPADIAPSSTADKERYTRSQHKGFYRRVKYLIISTFTAIITLITSI